MASILWDLRDGKTMEVKYNATIRVATSKGKRNIDCYFSDIRIKKQDIPEGYNRYSIRHADDDWVEPATLEPGVIVNHMADILTKETINFGKYGYFEIESINHHRS